MSTSQNNKKNYPPLILELADRRPSVFIMQGTNEALDTSCEFLLYPKSVMEKDGKRILTRYIANSAEYIVDVQKEKKIEPNPKNDIIIFTFGRLTVERSGVNIGLYDFLANHEGNRDAKHRPANAADSFYQINTEIQAEKELETLDYMTEAMSIVGELREKDGKTGFKYDTERIDKIGKLLGLVKLDTPAENLRVIVSVAMANPEFLVNVVNEENANMRVEIITAKELSVLSMDGPSASWLSDGKKFYNFKEQKNAEKRMLELAVYFNSVSGAEDLTVLKTKIKMAKEAQMSTT